MIKKLQEDIQRMADENEQLMAKIQQLRGDDEGPASQNVQLQFLVC